MNASPLSAPTSSGSSPTWCQVTLCARPRKQLATAVAANSPTALRATKQALWRSLEVGLTTAREEAATVIDGLAGHPDQEEGARAWLEKRRPRWQPLATSGGSMTYQRLIVERRGPVGWLINDRPDRLNAYDAVMRDEFRKGLG